MPLGREGKYTYYVDGEVGPDSLERQFSCTCTVLHQYIL